MPHSAFRPLGCWVLLSLISFSQIIFRRVLILGCFHLSAEMMDNLSHEFMQHRAFLFHKLYSCVMHINWWLPSHHFISYIRTACHSHLWHDCTHFAHVSAFTYFLYFQRVGYPIMPFTILHQLPRWEQPQYHLICARPCTVLLPHRHATTPTCYGYRPLRAPFYVNITLHFVMNWWYLKLLVQRALH